MSFGILLATCKNYLYTCWVNGRVDCKSGQYPSIIAVAITYDGNRRKQIKCKWNSRECKWREFIKKMYFYAF